MYWSDVQIIVAGVILIASMIIPLFLLGSLIETMFGKLGGRPPRK
jgi:hypothetical protein